MSWFITNLFAAFLLPPLSLLLVMLIGFLLRRKRPRTAHTLIAGAFIFLWLLATPFVAETLLQSLEGSPQALNHQTNTADAIVVLGGGTYFNMPEYAGDTVSSATLERIRYAAKLYRDTHKPILLTGGAPLGNSISEAQLMRNVLEEEFNTPVKWIETESNNTFENARYSFNLLQKSGIRRIFLVTHAWHMPRSVKVFQAAGFEVIPAPTLFTTRYQINLLAFIPSASALHSSQKYLHEMIGMLWYQLKSSL